MANYNGIRHSFKKIRSGHIVERLYDTRTPEPTSIARSSVFNNRQLDNFDVMELWRRIIYKKVQMLYPIWTRQMSKHEHRNIPWFFLEKKRYIVRPSETWIVFFFVRKSVNCAQILLR